MLFSLVLSAAYAMKWPRPDFFVIRRRFDIFRFMQLYCPWCCKRNEKPFITSDITKSKMIWRKVGLARLSSHNCVFSPYDFWCKVIRAKPTDFTSLNISNKSFLSFCSVVGQVQRTSIKNKQTRDPIKTWHFLSILQDYTLKLLEPLLKFNN